MSNQTIYQLKESVEYEVVDGIVFIITRHNHRIQRFMRKLKFKIPEISRLELDEYGSFVFLQIDGEKTIEDVATCLDIKYQDAAHPLYERLTPYLDYLHNNLEVIEMR